MWLCLINTETLWYLGTAVSSLKESQVMCSRPHLAEPMCSLGKWPNIPSHVRKMLFKWGCLILFLLNLTILFLPLQHFHHGFWRSFCLGFQECGKSTLISFWVVIWGMLPHFWYYVMSHQITKKRPYISLNDFTSFLI